MQEKKKNNDQFFLNLYIFKQVPSTKSVPLFMNDQMGKFRVDHNIPSTVTVP